MGKIKNYYSDQITRKIDEVVVQEKNQIIVIQVQIELIDFESREQYISDVTTFRLNAGAKVFDKNWFQQLFFELNQSREYHILSFAQFAYIESYIDNYFNDRVVIIKDNLRQLFPLDASEYIEDLHGVNEKRPDDLPLYQMEQVCVSGRYYYSAKSLTQNQYKGIVDVFTTRKRLSTSNGLELEQLDMHSDPFLLDCLINSCFEENDFFKHINVIIHRKNIINDAVMEILEQFNHVLSEFQGALFVLRESPVDLSYESKGRALPILKEYWGVDAEFRKLKIYVNPGEKKQTIDISQEQIIEEVIVQYEKAKLNDDNYRDIFLTAPTGSGKSLLFQIPAFYISNKNDVTLIVSPLIALMKDQVTSIQRNRGFEKVAYLNSELNFIDRNKVIEQCKNGYIDVLYLAPELLLSFDIRYFIGERKIGLFVVDEAHLITTWGRDFRVDYWYLGNHIANIRKYLEFQFPMVAFTATAIYGGFEDMVFDSTDSLQMKDPIIYVGQVRRDDIKFVVGLYQRVNNKRSETFKIQQTVDFIKGVTAFKAKTLIYCPYTRHIDKIYDSLPHNMKPMCVTYYGKLQSDLKEEAYRMFKSGKAFVMIATKAFGMGVDISDIQIVYHHAPSGLLTDYVQEIGRVARLPDIEGYACINYSISDQKYAKILHGLSSLKQYQIKNVLRKIHSIYQKERNQNLLLSAQDFGYIFEDDLEQKALSALMMIEKDYLSRYRFNVIKTRPKKLFAKVYAKLSRNDLQKAQKKFHRYFKKVRDRKLDVIVDINLDNLCKDHFRERSFPSLKRLFYNKELFKNEDFKIEPQVQISFQVDNKNIAVRELKRFFLHIESILKNFGKRYFFEEEFIDRFNESLSDKKRASTLTKYLLSNYAGILERPGVLQSHAFLHRRKSRKGYADKNEYSAFGTKYTGYFNVIKRSLNTLVSEKNHDRFISHDDPKLDIYIRLGHYLEMLDLGTFEVKGGEKLMISLRINDPQTIKRDVVRHKYSNQLLKRTVNKHHISNKILNYFFETDISDTERWDFIEDYFLGEDEENLLKNYCGDNTIEIDIVKVLKKKNISPFIKQKNENQGGYNGDSSVIFAPDSEQFYTHENFITFPENDISKTMKISRWLRENPVLLHRKQKELQLKMTREIHKELYSRIKVQDLQYYKEIMGLKYRISFPGYHKPIQAEIPYKDEPVKFYKWWLKNGDEICLSTRDRIYLFQNVNNIDSKVLRKKHLRILLNK